MGIFPDFSHVTSYSQVFSAIMTHEHFVALKRAQGVARARARTLQKSAGDLRRLVPATRLFRLSQAFYENILLKTTLKNSYPRFEDSTGTEDT